MGNKRKSKHAAIDNAKRLFADTPDQDTITIEQAIKSWGRPEDKDYETNKTWLANKLTDLKYYKLVTPLYDYGDGRKKLNKIQLTMEGKKALGRLQTEPTEEIEVNKKQKVLITDVLSLVARLKKENPEYEIIFDMKLKENIS